MNLHDLYIYIEYTVPSQSSFGSRQVLPPAATDQLPARSPPARQKPRPSRVALRRMARRDRSRIVSNSPLETSEKVEVDGERKMCI